MTRSSNELDRRQAIRKELRETELERDALAHELALIYDAWKRPEDAFEAAWSPVVSYTYECPECGQEIDIREAKAL